MKFFAGVILLVLLGFNKCDGVKPVSRIVGGSTTTIESSPYQVSVRVDDAHTCGGAILDSTTIITAAHCSDGLRPRSMSIRTGATIADEGIKHTVQRIIEHPDYDDATYENDVCLLKIFPPIQFTKSSQPIKMAEERLADGTNVKVSGWGKTSEDASNKNIGKQPLRFAIVNVVNQSVCGEDYESLELEIDNRRMCAAAKGKDSCQGDSGGPLVTVTGETSELIGVVSVGFGCANEEYPGVYTFLPSFKEFIEKNTDTLSINLNL